MPRGDPIVVTHPSGAQATMQRGVVFANDGTEIIAYKNLSDNKGFDTDCHGYTFAKGQVWINNDQADKLIKGDGYKQTDKPTAGGIVVLRGKDGNVVHSVKVTSVKNTKNGDAVTVKGEGGIETQAKKQNLDESLKEFNATGSYYTKGQKNKTVNDKDKEKLMSTGNKSSGGK